MSSTVHQCEHCQTTFATRSSLVRHVKCFHERRSDDNMELQCSSERCTFSTLYRGDLTRHLSKCVFVKTDNDIYNLQQQHESEISTYRETISRLQIQNQEMEMKLQLVTHYRESMIRMQVEIDMLRQQLDKAEHLVEKAIDRPGIITNNNNTQQIGSVKITNYLADHQAYVEHTDREFIIQQAKQFLEKYLTELINGQRALARFVVEHIIRCPDTGKFILCCTDTSRKRFIYINHVDEKAEDMFAKFFTERISGPIKEVSHTIFNQIVSKLEAQKLATKGAFDRGNIDDTIESITNKYLHILEFDVDDKNSEFIAELAGFLRGPNSCI